ncbi:MAG TPA: hypothetical protein VLB51_01600, partial [Methylomirabilota bacterium]|nr:hypothetical protein [Methylomirabilota bacterium]
MNRPILTVILFAAGLTAAGSSIPAATEEIDPSMSPGPLSRAHAELEDGMCDACHDDDLRIEADRCLVCHDLIADRIAAGKGVHREITGDCEVCHAEHGGRDADIRMIDTDDFAHEEETGFELVGAHARAAVEDCSSCHTTRSFLTLNPECSSCHENVHQGTLGDDCARCHEPTTPFAGASRAFHKDTLLPLEGRHLAVPCAECHWNGQLEGTPTRCYDCHWIRRQDDRHRTALGVECEECHRPISWTAVTFDHAAATGVVLVGSHASLDCDSCHVGGRFDGVLPIDCVGCHLDDYQGTDDPDHVAAGFPTDCQLCHSVASGTWDGAVFDHSAFQLVGVHATLDCLACHSGGVYQGLPSDCVDCHLDDHQGAINPNHVAAGFGTDCEPCHLPNDPSWNEGRYPHSVYPLVAAHAVQPCNACHGSNVFLGLPSECVDCHLADYQATDDPAHAAAGFPTDCQLCHSVASGTWDGATFDHSAFQLVGVHATLDCAACHSGGVYQGLPSECVDCHLSDHQGATNPDHAAAGFPTDCEPCHLPNDPSWNEGRFPHSVYPLVAAHAVQPCNACHGSNVFQGLPSECVDCHLDDYQGADDPDHVAAGFPTDCQLCHSVASGSWDGAVFDHTVYPLVGAHATLDCAECHSGGIYQGLPSECVDCHLADYQGTDDPDHVAAGFPTDCQLCHSVASGTWDGAVFDHSA